MHALPGPDSGLLEILNFLREANAFVSGEVLASRIGLSRAGVWKRLNRLKALGYVIDGEPRRGYRLVAAPDKLLPEEILHRLGTRTIRGPIYHFDCAVSTNDTAKLLGTQGAAEGTLVVAESQTGGRGRLGRSWLSPPGQGIYVSVVLRPPLPPGELPQITLSTAVAVVRALSRAAGLTPGIKWPNDVILKGKKIGGILTEMETESDQIRYLVVGLGLNVNNPEFPPELAGIATSLRREAGRPFSRLAILQAWLEEFENLYHDFLARGFPEILEEWKQHSVTLGKYVAVRQGSRQVEGLAREVAGDGALVLETARGEVVKVTSGEITVESPGMPPPGRG
uniref:Bifunctional ligase/repressor BirA n=1 Tax=Desulfobacca acetoxidans TaxID=60893 RepID=A0A7C3Z6X3_9BACT